MNNMLGKKYFGTFSAFAEILILIAIELFEILFVEFHLFYLPLIESQP